jgi:hypothetical protein
MQCIITQHTTSQQNTSQHNTSQRNTSQHNTTHHITTQQITTQHITIHNNHNTTRHNTTHHDTTQHNTSRHNVSSMKDVSLQACKRKTKFCRFSLHWSFKDTLSLAQYYRRSGDIDCILHSYARAILQRFVANNNATSCLYRYCATFLSPSHHLTSHH